MSEKHLVICVPEADYAYRLAAFLGEKKELAFQILVCAGPEETRKISDHQEIDVLLIDERYLPEQGEEIRAFRTVILTEEERETQDGQKNRIFKYQSGEKIFSEIVQMCLQDEPEGFHAVRKRESGSLTGFYSPIHRTGQTAYALEYGKKMAKEKNVLYLNMETYGGSGGHFPEESGRDMSVLLYYAKQGTGNIGLVLTTLVRQMDGLDYIAPSRFPEELQLVTEKEWKWLFSAILKHSVYDMLILDMGECIQGLYGILALCDEIYLLTENDRSANAKLKQYRETLKRLGYGEMWERMIRCDAGGTVA